MIRQSREKNPNNVFKTILVGDSGTGKSSVGQRYEKNEFLQTYKATIITDFFIKTTQYRGIPLKYNIWDTAGCQKFQAFASMYFKNSSVAILVYSLDSVNSLKNIENIWLPLLNKQLNVKNPDNEIILVLFGNKCDLTKNLNEKQMENYDQIKMIEKEYNCTSFVGSAKTGENVQLMMDHITQKLYTMITRKEQVSSLKYSVDKEEEDLKKEKKKLKYDQGKKKQCCNQ